MTLLNQKTFLHTPKVLCFGLITFGGIVHHSWIFKQTESLLKFKISLSGVKISLSGVSSD
jgi:hypothetical protein